MHKSTKYKCCFLGINYNYLNYTETVIKMASPKLGVLNKVRRFFTPDPCLLYKTQVRSGFELWSHLRDGSANHVLESLNRVKCCTNELQAMLRFYHTLNLCS